MMENKSDPPLLVSVVGPTAVGKTKFAIDLAIRIGTEVLSVDSRQFYRELEIGTAKPSADELAQVRHHFVNTHSIHDEYTVGQFEREAKLLLAKLFKEYRVVVAVGGSGLFFQALWEGFDAMPTIKPGVRERLNNEFLHGGLDPLVSRLEILDPEYFRQVDQKNYQRIIRALEVIESSGQPFSSFRKGKAEISTEYRHLKVGLDLPRETLFERINQRMDQMIEQGLFREAETLVAYKEHNALQTVGYKEIFDFLESKYDQTEAVRLLKRNSRRYAKRQLTWFRKYDDIRWVKPSDLDQVLGWI